MPRCAGRKEDGSPCERIVGASHTHCYSHDPKRAAERRRNASRGGRSMANAEIAGLKAQLKKLAADVLSGEVERGAATAVNQIINSQARLLELERKIRETEELEARLEALAIPFAEGVRDLEELSARHEVEADVEGVEEYQAIMTEAWHRLLESA